MLIKQGGGNNIVVRTTVCFDNGDIKITITIANRYIRDSECARRNQGNDSNLLIVFYVQIMPDDFVMQLHRF
ncbi:hypothetical protein BED05_18915 [Escherichia coli]|nr:hypothetical protein [Escherichia coli]